MLFNTIKREGNLIQRIPLSTIDEKTRELAKEKYYERAEEGSVLSEYDDDHWIFTSQDRGKVHIRFDYRQEEVMKTLAEIDKDYLEFIEELKVMAALRFGTTKQENIRTLVRYVIDRLVESHGFQTEPFPKMENNTTSILYLLEFMNLVNMGSDIYIQECRKRVGTIRAINAAKRKETKHPVALNEFMSYFIFDEIIRVEWTQMNDQEKRYYFPLYMFWVISTILPLRVTEFCVTPYDCIAQRAGKYYLTIRRSRLKGNVGHSLKIHFYTLDKDYETNEYEIPRWIYELIAWWRAETKDANHPFDTLFSIEFSQGVEYRRFRRNNPERTFTTDELGEIMKAFYEVYIIEKHNYTIVSDDELVERYNAGLGDYKLYDGETQRIYPKHTRHLAMINLICRGCNPMIIKDFAGHTTPDIDENYYGNTVKMVRCATKMLWDRSKAVRDTTYVSSETQEFNNLQLLIDPEAEHVKLDAGACYSELFLHGDVSDCQACGFECAMCPHFKADRRAKITKEREDRINEEAKLVMHMLKKPTIEAQIEEYQQSMLMLETDIIRYAHDFFNELKEKETAYVEV